MKKLFTILSIVCVTAVSADDDKFTKAMTGALEKLDTCETASSFLQVGNQISRIADAEGDQWLAYYWTSYCYAIVGFFSEGEEVDIILDQAQSYLDKADSLSPSNSEIYCLQSWIYSGRIMVDPMNRGMTYGMQSGQAVEQAIAFDENNPRAYFLKGSSFFYTPEMYGGGKDKAKVELETAIEKYDAFEPESELHPTWGRDQTEEMLEQCDEE